MYPCYYDGPNEICITHVQQMTVADIQPEVSVGGITTIVAHADWEP